jgi:SAM-dependent methyltransferase
MTDKTCTEPAGTACAAAPVARPASRGVSWRSRSESRRKRGGIDGESFSSYRARAAAPARAVFDLYPPHALDEQAGPAYLEGMALSRWVFWRRLATVAGLLPAAGTGTCVDFGCGLGLLLPLLKRRFASVYGVDIMPELAQEFLHGWAAAYGDSCDDIAICRNLQAAGLADGSVDLILALDVLEHVDDLENVAGTMRRLLKPNGLLLVCGPTENWIYKLGRRLVGFSGEYHRRNIFDIRQVLEDGFRVRTVKRLFYPFTLFTFLAAAKT